MLHPLLNATADFGNSALMNNAWADQFLGAYFSNKEERTNFIASPALMTTEQAKQYMPSTTIITSDNDSLKTQGEDFARLLQSADVSCGIAQAGGSLHDVQVFCRARDSPTADLIMTLISGKLRAVLLMEK